MGDLMQGRSGGVHLFEVVVVFVFGRLRFFRAPKLKVRTSTSGQSQATMSLGKLGLGKLDLGKFSLGKFSQNRPGGWDCSIG
jgi:hypothetical protein